MCSTAENIKSAFLLFLLRCAPRLLGIFFNYNDFRQIVLSTFSHILEHWAATDRTWVIMECRNKEGFFPEIMVWGFPPFSIWRRKTYEITDMTLKFFFLFLFMNYFDMFFQVLWTRKCFWTRFALNFFFMLPLLVSIDIVFKCEFHVTNITFEFFLLNFSIFLNNWVLFWFRFNFHI